jgi:peptide deformylase
MILSLVTDPDPRLHTYAQYVPHEGIDEAYKMSSLMFNAMERWNGIGLASVQVGLTGRYFVFKWNGEGNPQWVVNPEIVASTGLELREELCLSVPGVAVPKARASYIEVAQRHTDWGTIRCSGLTARIMQHEIDHLNGRLITDK